MDGRQRLVLVDSDECVRAHVTETLVEQGFNCVGVSDLARAAAVSERLPVSGVLVNVGSLNPQLVEAMVRFRRLHPNLPLLAFDPPEVTPSKSGKRGVVRKHLRLVTADEAFAAAAGEQSAVLH